MAGFVFFHIPFNSIILVALLKNESSINLQSSYVFIAFLFSYLNSAINPLCLSFISLEPAIRRALIINVEMLPLENNTNGSRQEEESNEIKDCSCSNNPSCRNCCFKVAETNDGKVEEEEE